MTATLLVIHVLLASALIGVILLQRTSSDGSGLTGGSGAAGGAMSARGTANLLTRTTSFLATAFIATSILLTILGGAGNKPKSLADEIKPAAMQDAIQVEPPVAGNVDAPKQSTPQQSIPAVPLSK